MPGQQLHGQEEQLAFASRRHPDIEDATDVGVGDLAGVLDFAPKTLQLNGVAGDGGVQGLQRQVYPQGGVPGREHFARGPGADQPQDLVALRHNISG